MLLAGWFIVRFRGPRASEAGAATGGKSILHRLKTAFRGKGGEDHRTAGGPGVNLGSQGGRDPAPSYQV